MIALWIGIGIVIGLGVGLLVKSTSNACVGYNPPPKNGVRPPTPPPLPPPPKYDFARSFVHRRPEPEGRAPTKRQALPPLQWASKRLKV